MNASKQPLSISADFIVCDTCACACTKRRLSCRVVLSTSKPYRTIKGTAFFMRTSSKPLLISIAFVCCSFLLFLSFRISYFRSVFFFFLLWGLFYSILTRHCCVPKVEIDSRGSPAHKHTILRCVSHGCVGIETFVSFKYNVRCLARKPPASTIWQLCLRPNELVYPRYGYIANPSLIAGCNMYVGLTETSFWCLCRLELFLFSYVCCVFAPWPIRLRHIVCGF